MGLSVFASILISESPEFSMGPMEPPKHVQFRGSFHGPSDVQAPSIMISESLEHSMEPVEPLDVQFLGSFHGPSDVQPPSIIISESEGPLDDQPPIIISESPEQSLEVMEPSMHVQFSDVQSPCPGAIEQLRKDAPSGIPLAPPTAPIIHVGNDDPFDVP